MTSPTDARCVQAGMMSRMQIKIKMFCADCKGIIRKIASVWDSPELLEIEAITISSRMIKNYGKCNVGKKELVLSSDLLFVDKEDLIYEVLVHEAAHLVVFSRVGRAAKPHGPEWRSLVEAAGVVPRIAVEGYRSFGVSVDIPSHDLFEHRCPICQTRRIARRPVLAWKCRRCLEAGLDGKMVINQLTPAKDGKNAKA